MFKNDLLLASPLMNAAGFLGFTLSGRDYLDLGHLGAFITNPISMEARTPAAGCRYLAYPGGFLMHNGHPNPGFRRALQRYAPAWSRSPLPVIVHLLAQKPAELQNMTRRLETLEGVIGVEIGLPPDIAPADAVTLVSAAVCELPLIVRLPFTDAAQLAPKMVAAGAAAVSLGAPRGALPEPNGRLVRGRLYGPSIYPQALETVQVIAAGHIPVYAAGGVYTQPQVEAMLAAGAAAVQLDSVLWQGGD